MPRTPTKKIMLDLAPRLMGQCCHVYHPHDRQLGPVYDDSDLPRALPKMDFTKRDWRKVCMKEKGHIPAGYTYLGQLIGHDVGDSRNANQIPHVQTSTAPSDVAQTQTEVEVESGCEGSDDKGIQTDANLNHNGRYNIIENPLTFETLYGSGPINLHHVFDPVTMLFRVPIDSHLAIDLSTGPHRHIYALYDVRNRDNLMVHQLAVTWMRYHNYVALFFRADLMERADKEIGLAREVFVKTRKYVLATWHRVIREDYINALIHPDVAAMSNAAIAEFAEVDETTLQHGVFRTFHCMPRKDYRMEMGGIQELSGLLASDLPRPSDGEHFRWKANLEEMFDHGAQDGDKTGVSASLTHALRHMMRRDFLTAKDTRPLRRLDEKIADVVGSLPNAAWREQLSPDALSAAFNARIAPYTGDTLTAEAFLKMPLYVLLMIEAQLYGGPGHLGPLGSVLLRRALTQRIEDVSYGKEDIPVDGPTPLSSMSEIIRTLKGNGYV